VYLINRQELHYPIELNISLPDYPESVTPPTTLPVTGIRGVTGDSGAVYITGILNSGGSSDEAFGMIYEGPINMSNSGGWHALSFPDSGGEIVTGTAFYGPNNGSGAVVINIVGNYTNSGSSAALGLLYQGHLDGTGFWRTLSPTYLGETTLNTIAHSNMGDLAVGNKILIYLQEELLFIIWILIFMMILKNQMQSVLLLMGFGIMVGIVTP
jgi:hypothetical protein